MKIIKSESLNFKQKQILFGLWNSEYPEKICFKDIFEFECYLKSLLNQKHYLLINYLEEILGWGFTFERENDNWFGLIVNSKSHRKGLGTLLLNELKKNNQVLNGWVINHNNDLKHNKESYLSPIKFYIKNDFLIYKNIKIKNDVISAIKIKWKVYSFE